MSRNPAAAASRRPASEARTASLKRLSTEDHRLGIGRAVRRRDGVAAQVTERTQLLSRFGVQRFGSGRRGGVPAELRPGTPSGAWLPREKRRRHSSFLPDRSEGHKARTGGLRCISRGPSGSRPGAPSVCRANRPGIRDRSPGLRDPARRLFSTTSAPVRGKAPASPTERECPTGRGSSARHRRDRPDR